jgi:hypothetical protein
MRRETAPTTSFLYSSMKTTSALLLLAAVIVTLLSPVLSRLDLLMRGSDLHVHQSWEAHNRRSLDAGEIPLWNPYAYGGSPAMAELQSQTFYPPAILLRWLPLNEYFSWSIALHLWVLGAGLYLLARDIGVGRAAATAGALAMVLCGSVTQRLYLGHFTVLETYAWFPLALAFARRGMTNGRLAPHPGLVAVLTIQILAGFPQGPAYTVAGLAGFALFTVAWPESGRTYPRWRPLLQPVLAGIVAIGLTSFQLFPWARLLSASGRAVSISWERATEGSLGLRHLSTVVFPQGLNVFSEEEGLLFVTVALASFIPLAWRARDRRRTTWALAVLAGLALAFAAGNNLPFYRLHAAQRTDVPRGAIYNVGSGRQTTVGDAVRVARNVLDIATEPEWSSMPDRLWDSSTWVANTARIEADLGWTAQTRFEEGFRRFAGWMRAHSGRYTPMTP